MTKGIYDDYKTLTSDNASGLKYLSAHQYIGVKRPGLYIKGRQVNEGYKNYINSLFPGFVKNIAHSAYEITNELKASNFVKIQKLQRFQSMWREQREVAAAFC